MKRTRGARPGPRKLIEKPVRVQFRMDEREYEALIDYAARLHVHTSELLRDLIRAKVQAEGKEAEEYLRSRGFVPRGEKKR